MIIYLLKTIACSAVFYALYHFIFRKEKMLIFNRFYLLGSLYLSFFIPLLTFTVKTPALRTEQYNFSSVLERSSFPEGVVATNNGKLWIYLIVSVFILISAFFAYKFIRNFRTICQMISRNEKIYFSYGRIVLIENFKEPFSFFNNIFLNKDEYKEGRVEEEILIHEMAHIRQNHSLEILILEILKIFYWFNPLLYLYLQAIKMNHEFLADDAVVRRTNDSLQYQQLLIKCIYVNQKIPLASSFYFITKKRLIMLQKKFKKRRVFQFGFLLIPITALAIYGFSNKKMVPEKNYESNFAFADNSDLSYGLNDTDKVKVSEVYITDSVSKPVSVEDDTKRVRPSKYSEVTITDVVVQGDTTPPKPLPPPPPKKVKPFAEPKYGQGASKEEMDEYNSILNELKIERNGKTSYKYVENKSNRIYEIYRKMNKPQRESVVSIPPPPPPQKSKKPVRFTPPKIVKDEKVG
ncbi:MAG: M56 family metallopeptidase [Chitinophagaceae bacterium]|nr:M56 family metallopeptidase [Chitinophagaceae bacterium]